MKNKINNKVQTIITLLLCVMIAFAFTACGDRNEETSNGDAAATIMFTDDCERTVEIPKNITKVAPSGAVAQMVLMTIAPDTLVGLANDPVDSQMEYFPKNAGELPVFGQFYGSKANLNMEALIKADPQVRIDIGDKKETHKEDMDRIQEKTGIPAIFVETTLDKMPDAYRTLGKLLGQEKRGEEQAAYIENTVKTAQKNAEKVKEKKTVYYGCGESGLDCNAAGSVQADVIDIIGAENAIVVEEINNAGGGTQINMEELYINDPDVIILTSEGSYEMVNSNAQWAKLNAVKNDNVYEIPGVPYCWMSAPPSVNRVLGIWWLGNLVYPDIYDYDMAEKTIEYYSLFFNYDMTAEQANEMLKNSTFKAIDEIR